MFAKLAPADFAIVTTEAREYSAADGRRFRVDVFQTNSTSAAYSLLRHVAAADNNLFGPLGVIDNLGAVGAVARNRVSFIKGHAFVDVSEPDGRAGQPEEALIAFARQLAEKLEGVAGDVPVLVQHLPDWEKVNESTAYAVTLPALQSAAGDEPALEAVSFDGGGEAVTARYDSARLVIVEFTTPQYAADNDARITQRIARLRGENGPAPSAYRRVGNYSVFVFGAPDEAAATRLIDSVKYEKEVRWLGDNPRALERAQRAYGATTAAMILTTLKITGVSILLCFGLGGLFGGAIFMYRRTRSATAEVYTDAGGMVRLNIDDITPRTHSTRLLSEGKK
ncbi:MAG: DUF6599 family protein [Pyrinomonadaceae bacterium]